MENKETKIITVPYDLARKLNKTKYDLGLTTISDVIERLFKITEKINLEEKKNANDANVNGSA